MQTAGSMIIDREKILAPISAQLPAGELLRYEGTYDRIQNARRKDDPNLAQGVWERELKEANWELVGRICTESLETRTKDLQIAVWLLESLLHLHGFAGVQEGLTTIEDLCRTYWDTLHPSLEDPEYRLSIFQWVNEKLSLQLKFIPVTNPPRVANALPYSYWDWEMAMQAEQKTRQHRPVESGSTSASAEITIAKFQQSALLSPPDFLSPLCDDLRAVSSTCKSLEAFLDSQFGKTAPSLRAFREIPEAIESLIQRITGGVRAPAAPDANENREVPNPEATGEPATADSADTPVLPPIRSRDDAYQRLADAAEYLFRTEPHSPTPYLVRKAIAWGNMTLDELLPELVRNESALQETRKLLRVEQKKDPMP